MYLYAGCLKIMVYFQNKSIRISIYLEKSCTAYHITVTMAKKNCISIQQCFVTGSQPFALKCFRVLKWNNLPWSISAHRFGIVGRYNLLQSSDRQGLLNNKYTLGQVWGHILKQEISLDISIFYFPP